MKRLLLAALVSGQAFAAGAPAKIEVVGEYYCDPAKMVWKTVRQSSKNIYRPVQGMCGKQRGMTCTVYMTTANDKAKTKSFKEVCK